ncbi:MAG TPA: DUF308 domain-containing protein [Burkholderiaceae bacterium]|nr:DUF308 domain-containing protein [Burkholderiaceae bacterium]
MTQLADRWWLLLINGLCAIVFGVLSFSMARLDADRAGGAVRCIVDGITALMAARARNEAGRPWGQMAFVGVVSILAGIAALVWPGLTGIVLLIMIAVWAIVRGVLEIIAAVELRKRIDNEWLLALSGAISVLFGIALLVAPGQGAVALIWVIAAFAIVHGVLLVMLAFKVRGLRRGVASAA